MQKVCLIIIDGFGVAPEGPGNARTLAKLPTIDRMEAEVPNVLTDASGNAVGLPEGQMGASEPGHLTLGAGRVVWQPLEEINQAIRSEAFFHNPVLIAACDRANERGVPLHLVGIYSSGDVHGSMAHFHAMLELAKSKGVETVYLHLFGDGRDVPEQHFCTDFKVLEEEITHTHLGVIASLVGRYFAMDRDKQYEVRTKVAYDLLTQGVGETVEDLCQGARDWYLTATDTERTDYYIRPLKMPEFQPIKPDDAVVCINFRSDRMIQIVRALEAEDFHDFPRSVRITDVTCMGPYSPHLPVAFPPPNVEHTLGQIVAEAGLKQLRVAETEKFAHVTFFFNAQRHEPFAGEDRIMIPTPKVANMADAPEMSANDVAKTVMEDAKQQGHDLIVVNFANPDVVGHGGKLDAVVTACEAVDRNLALLLPVLESSGYEWIVTADHGNAEEMYYPGTETICPSHTTNQVQTFVHSRLIGSAKDLAEVKTLKDIAPLVLRMMELPVPSEMR